MVYSGYGSSRGSFGKIYHTITTVPIYGMKQEQFIQQLEQLAEIKPVKVPVHGNRREAREACDIFRNGETVYIDNKNNKTLGYEIKRLKTVKTACEDCGKQVQDRRIWNRIMYTPSRHWRKTCSSCNLTQHPETKQFTVSNNRVLEVFREYLNKSGNNTK